ncbi:tRNA (adenine(22)-N(1))-methyltransferase TrmK [Paenibacillus sp. P96]|uniref:tRNA (Adenine(22)-N(1))-methyltransferase TrmK n=1 Tax=Paenibacillus zeirhizosphaerae TaxID=2987519 RepID=A0ABT9FR17_9BACL|nr:class I SAM-dependent methyltransferase [Paenibacillus sp. P96]MDP4096971.1 tRNA (adenine(22)-N(1))-methyltransferase TrmK [Paenibacillus sp. P96]
MKLSQRLQYILEQIPPDSVLADIGSDHALLPVAAVQSGRVIKGIAGEVNAGPLRAARKQVADAGLSGKIDVRHGNGLQVLNAGEADVITIAGMGGALIATILDEGQDKLSGVRQLVLQPNVGEDMLRRWLLHSGWVITGEHILEEDGKIYEVLTALPEAESSLSQEELYAPVQLEGGLALASDLLIRMGPHLVKTPNEVFFKKWRGEIAKLQSVLKQVERSELESAREKKEELRRQIEQLEEVLACMQKDRL